MSQQLITIPKSALEELINRIGRLEKAVFEKNSLDKVINTYKQEKQKGKLKKLQSIDELFT
jgi:uncharacterized protein (UPF0335 family)